MLKFGEFICKHKKIILVISILLLIPSILGIKATKINYDILVYLPSDIETVQGENILSEDFDMGAFSIVVLENMKSKEIAKLETEVKKNTRSRKCSKYCRCYRNKYSSRKFTTRGKRQNI